jgi:hypothetical protein
MRSLQIRLIKNNVIPIHENENRFEYFDISYITLILNNIFIEMLF